MIEKKLLIEKTIKIRRVTKVVKGGRRFSFSAFVVVGDGNGKAGFGLGKANEITEAIRKASDNAKKSMHLFKIVNNTIPHEAYAKFGAGRLIIKPAKEGSGIIAAGCIRSLMECIGIKDINVKSVGTQNPLNMVKAAFLVMRQLRTYDEQIKLRT